MILQHLGDMALGHTVMLVIRGGMTISQCIEATSK